MGSLDGKVIIVTGASRGIGAAAAASLAQAGATVVLTARDGKLTGEVARSIGGSASARAPDVSRFTSVRGPGPGNQHPVLRLATLDNNAPPNEARTLLPPSGP